MSWRCSPAFSMYSWTAVERRQHLDLLAGRQPPRGQGGVGRGLRGRLEALAGADAVADHAERAGGGDPRVLLPQRSGGGVARVGERGLAGVAHRLVEPLERLAGQEHLAADLDQRRHRELVGAGQPVRDGVDGLDVGGDVLAGAAVAAGERPDQPAALVEQVDGEAVDLELAQQRRRLDPVAAEPGVPGGELVVGERVVEALHPLEVVDGGELRRDRAADLLGRRVGRAQLGELLLELLEARAAPRRSRRRTASGRRARSSASGRPRPARRGPGARPAPRPTRSTPAPVPRRSWDTSCRVTPTAAARAPTGLGARDAVHTELTRPSRKMACRRDETHPYHLMKRNRFVSSSDWIPDDPHPHRHPQPASPRRGRA